MITHPSGNVNIVPTLQTIKTYLDIRYYLCYNKEKVFLSDIYRKKNGTVYVLESNTVLFCIYREVI